MINYYPIKSREVHWSLSLWAVCPLLACGIVDTFFQQHNHAKQVTKSNCKFGTCASISHYWLLTWILSLSSARPERQAIARTHTQTVYCNNKMIGGNKGQDTCHIMEGCKVDWSTCKGWGGHTFFFFW